MYVSPRPLLTLSHALRSSPQVISPVFSLPSLTCPLVNPAPISSPQAKLRATRCKALQLFLIPLRCGQETCDKDPVTAQQVCSIKMVDCFAPQWRVEFTQVDSEGEEMQHKSVNSWINDSPYLSQVTAERMMAKHPVSSSAVCTYDSSDPNHVVWGYDDPQPWLIAMIVAWCVVGLFVCVLGFGWFFARETGV